jgi:hypothetical protein
MAIRTARARRSTCGNGLGNLSDAQGRLTFAAEELEEWGNQSVGVRNLPGAGLGPGKVRRGSFR